MTRSPGLTRGPGHHPGARHRCKYDDLLGGELGRARRLEDMTLEEVERYLIERALATQGGKVSEGARVLGLSRSAL
jgi:DNA-binding NtrC family response regulator